VVQVDLRPGTDVEAFVERVKSPPVARTEQDIQVPVLPDDLVNFGRVDAAPALVAGSMALVAVATLLHALVSTVRRRLRDVAVLRVLGFTGRQVLATVSWQATTLVLVAAVPALLIGVVVGRWAWQYFADELRVVNEPVVPVLLILGATLGSLLLANLVAFSAGRWASRRSAAVILRSE
jgi:putative ABC transport system permease protein